MTETDQKPKIAVLTKKWSKKWFKNLDTGKTQNDKNN